MPKKPQLHKKKKNAPWHKNWQPFKRHTPLSREEAEYIVRGSLPETYAEDWPEERVLQAIDDLLTCDIYTNNIYQVAVYPAAKTGPESWPAMIHLSIKRLDRAPVTSWSHLQRIKNELVGEEHEAVELFPAESRLVNMANQYHMWCLADGELRFPFGFDDGRQICKESKGAAKQSFVSTTSKE